MTRDDLEALADRLLRAAEEVIAVLDALRDADAEDDGSAEPPQAARAQTVDQRRWSGAP